MMGAATAATTNAAPALPEGIVRASWPDALPPLHAKHFLSIICGNSRIHWCLHDSYQLDFCPSSLWKTGMIEPFDKTKKSREAHLSTYLPAGVFLSMFGTQAGPNDVEITAQFATRQVSMLPVYVISTNDTSLSALVELLAPLPVRIFLMQTQDFGRETYPGMGVDRVAALQGAEALYGRPSLVIDGGTALTWTATDGETEGVPGGGICPGVGMRFRSLNEFTGKLAHISHAEVEERLNRCILEKTPLPLCAGNTKDAIISSVCHEMALLLAHVIREWTAKNKGSQQIDGEAKKTGVTICLTGGDAQVFRKLLEPAHSHILPQGGQGLKVPNDATLEVRKNLIHDGIAALLLEKTPPQKDLGKKERVRSSCIGQRVIIRNDGDEIFRGSILGVDRAEQVVDDVFLVKIDLMPYRIEPVGAALLCDVLKSYSNLGESKTVEDRITVLVAKAAEEGDTSGICLRPEMKKMRSATAAATLEKHLSGQDNDSSTAGQVGNAKRPGTSSNEPRKKSHTPPSLDEESARANPEAYLERRIAKCFEDGVWYFGTVAKYAPRVLPEEEVITPLWKVRYDDGDKEEFDAADLIAHLTEYEFNKTSDMNE